MKKFLIIILISVLAITLSAVINNQAQAVTATPTVNQTLLEKLGNEIASKTAQLNLVEKKGIIGTVTDSSSAQITLSDVNGNIRFVDVDELTKFSSDSSSSFGISDVKKGAILGVLGLYNKQSRRILARSINVLTPFPTIVFGEIANVDKVNFELTVVKANGGRTILEIETITKSYSFSGGNLITSGFSKIQATQTISAIGFPDKQDPNKIMASQIIIFPDIQLSYNLNLTPSATIAPSTGSGVKLYPIKK